MSFINTIPPDEATGETKELYQRQQDHYGYVPNYAKVFCYRPSLMTAWANLQRTARKYIDVKSYELVTVAAATSLKNSYCSLAHGKLLNDHFYSIDELEDIVKRGGENTLTQQQICIVKLAKKVTLNAEGVNQQDIDELKQTGMSDERIFDVVVSAAARCFFSKISDALGVQPDSVLSEMDEGIVSLMTLGRNISSEPVERIEVEKSDLIKEKVG